MKATARRHGFFMTRDFKGLDYRANLQIVLSRSTEREVLQLELRSATEILELLAVGPEVDPVLLAAEKQ